MTRSERGLLAGALISALGVRLVLIEAYPDNFSMDGYQRWAGRDHLLVQDWLPATQTVIHTVASLGGGILEMRWAMAVIAALAVAAGAMVARELGGVVAGWLFLPLATFGPFLTWSVVPYQEGTYLLTVLGSVALVLRGKRLSWAPEHRAWLLADLLAGAAALVRYEGWVFLLLYMVWRRDIRVVRAAWGAAFWLGVKASGAQGYAASPIDFADWGGLSDRYSANDLGKTLRKFGRHAADTWLPVLAGLGAAGLGVLWRRRTPGLKILLALLGLQLAATLGWMIGLETATYRMQAVPGVLLGLIAAAGGGLVLQNKPRWAAGLALVAAFGLTVHFVPQVRNVFLVLFGLLAAGGGGLILRDKPRWAVGLWLLVAFGLSAHFIPQAHNNAKRSTRSVKWEQRLVKKMKTCQDCRWAITPRRGIGTRDRHDGCEIIQGLGDFRHGEDFWCTTWQEAAPFTPTHRARWRKGGYKVEGR